MIFVAIALDGPGIGSDGLIQCDEGLGVGIMPE